MREHSPEVDMEVSSSLVQLPLGRDYSSVELVEGMKQRDTRAMSAFFDAYADKVNALVWRLLGADPEHDDLVNTAFLNILASIGSLKDPQALASWVSMLTINTVRKEIRNRRYKRLFAARMEHAEAFSESLPEQTDDVLGRVFTILRAMKPDSQIVFVLRYMERRTFEEIARLSGCSLATAKRRGKRCKKEFLARAQRDSVLSGYLEGGDDD